MKIENGMYVRTKDGNILKFGFQLKDVKKASYNIIDLIEVGDYVNGCKIDFMNLDYVKPYIRYGISHFLNEDIKSVVTHEQFEKMKYEVEQ